MDTWQTNEHNLFETPFARFIAIEGIDGTGKTSVTEQLGVMLRERSIPTECTAEPTNGPVGQAVRHMLHVKKGSISPAFREIIMQSLLRDRNSHMILILAAMDEGTAVITDRYYFSNAVYQCEDAIEEEAEKKSMQAIIKTNETMFAIPKHTFVLTADPKLVIRRITERGVPLSIFETESTLEKMQRRFNLLQDLTTKTTLHYIPIDDKSVQEVATEIIKVLEEDQEFGLSKA